MTRLLLHTSYRILAPVLKNCQARAHLSPQISACHCSVAEGNQLTGLIAVCCADTASACITELIIVEMNQMLLHRAPAAVARRHQVPALSKAAPLPGCLLFPCFTVRFYRSINNMLQM
jgi:hypothetical protein